jgi:hypothetical protein
VGGAPPRAISPVVSPSDTDTCAVPKLARVKVENGAAMSLGGAVLLFLADP